MSVSEVFGMRHAQDAELECIVLRTSQREPAGREAAFAQLFWSSKWREVVVTTKALPQGEEDPVVEYAFAATHRCVTHLPRGPKP